MRIRLALAAVLLHSCSHPAPRTWEGRGEGDSTSCELKAGTNCGIGSLTRVSEGDWAPGELAAFLARTPEGTAAVSRNGGQLRLVPDCHLRGKYGEVQGKSGAGRFWTASAGSIFVPQEIDPACLEATHVIAVFATRNGHFGAMLVPLPCPSVSDPSPAIGCIGRGLNGPERQARARALRKGLGHPRDPGVLLDIYALSPTDVSFSFLLETGFDCAFMVHVVYARDRFQSLNLGPLPNGDAPDRPYPDFNETLGRNCGYGPPFLFDPAPGSGPGCWTAANPSGYP
jgi:hypothetical protein